MSSTEFGPCLDPVSNTPPIEFVSVFFFFFFLNNWGNPNTDSRVGAMEEFRLMCEVQ